MINSIKVNDRFMSRGILIVFGFLSFIFFISNVHASSCPLSLQQAYKTANSPAIYYITENCTKRAFNKANVFFTYFDSWANVKIVSSEVLNSIPNDSLGFMPWGPKYDPKYGALVKIVKDPKVYLLLGTEKYWITSESVFNNLNYFWNWIEDIDQRLLDKYQTASEINYTNHHPNYTLVKYANDAKVYRLEPDSNDSTKQIKKYIKNEAEFNALGFRWDRIVTIKSSEIYVDTDSTKDSAPVLSNGCKYSNPVCGSDYDCTNNQCIKKQGCSYSNPVCENNYSCINNQCILKSGCQYNNPTCENGKQCSNNQCVSSLYDNEGRISDYARSFKPSMLTVYWSNIEKIYPEKYGKNYYNPGTYNAGVGDGFGKGDFLVKLVNFVPKDPVTFEGGYFEIEVFKKESDGHYYHYQTIENRIAHTSFFQLFDIALEWLYDDSDSDNLYTFRYHDNCSVYFNYCSDASSPFQTDSSLSCNWRCPFLANNDEAKSSKGKFSAIFPFAYKNLADFSVDALEKCYQNTVDFLGYDIDKFRIGIKVFSGASGSSLTGLDEYVSTVWNKSIFDANVSILDDWKRLNQNSRCSNFMALGHELTHVFAEEMLGDNYGLNEGLADFVAFNNGREYNNYCFADGWSYNKDGYDIKKYVSLSSSPSDNSPANDFYLTGFCFWSDVEKEYGYNKFVRMMQELYQKSRGASDYYVLDIIKNIGGHDLPNIIKNRYDITREATRVELCKNCNVYK